MPGENKNTRIIWKTLENFYFEKTKIWFTIAVIAAIILNVISIFTKDTLLIMVSVLATVVFFIYETREPEEIEIELDERGIKAGKKFCQYSELQSFWIFYNPPFNYISIKSKKTLIPYIKILFDGQNPVELRHFLIEHIPEVEQKEGWMEIIERLLKL